MKVGVIGAMAQEVEILVSLMKNLTKTPLANCTLYQGQIQGIDVVLMQSGIGKVAAAVGTTALLQLTQPDMVINTGSAGGIAAGLSVGDIVISEQTCHHDADVTAFGYAMGQLPNCPARFPSDPHLVKLATDILQQQNKQAKLGLICSGDSFVQGGDALAKIKQYFPEAIAVEMEAAAIAQVCYMFNVPFVVVRAISDNGDSGATMSFEEFLPIAAQSSSQIVLAMLEKLAKSL
ncbi:5'-methylthioadenosine/adenosylhomocysteine nucleosidase [Volucribacter amazonae]|uniref:5'-methylthioadenosine/S-adenosylhomocysteine nucleosidase n=1 Tax=Volucribacter amazonae TaxID=256731 RepID=A0A9X4SIH7_9PAST|nr:5'-methylthioadenosine/adenosylhomocysteine nucleosidase [Volucribacter amazonae]MDG6895650.1 5'-methylthioadenosine/S-adenosylhomocysteine nucleosidase [Volucribacter amazonae]